MKNDKAEKCLIESVTNFSVEKCRHRRRRALLASRPSHKSRRGWAVIEGKKPCLHTKVFLSFILYKPLKRRKRIYRFRLFQIPKYISEVFILTEENFQLKFRINWLFQVPFGSVNIKTLKRRICPSPFPTTLSNFIESYLTALSTKNMLS